MGTLYVACVELSQSSLECPPFSSHGGVIDSDLFEIDGTFKRDPTDLNEPCADSGVQLLLLGLRRTLPEDMSSARALRRARRLSPLAIPDVTSVGDHCREFLSLIGGGAEACLVFSLLRGVLELSSSLVVHTDFLSSRFFRGLDLDDDANEGGDIAHYGT